MKHLNYIQNQCGLNQEKLLGIKINDLTGSSIEKVLSEFSNSKKFNTITPINPELIIMARSDEEFRETLNKSTVTTCDGAGISIALKLAKKPIKKYAGSSMIFDILDFAERNNKKVFFLGTKPHINKKARENVKKKYPKLKIAGYSPPPYVQYPNRKFPKIEEDKIIIEIKKFKPDIICAFWGAPFQETWFLENKEKLAKLGARIGVSMGGTADFLSGYTKRAPKFFQKTNLEWVYRLATEKNRFKRFATRIPIFVVLALKEGLFGRKI